MKLDDICFEVGDIEISPCKTVINNKTIENTKSIKVFSNDKEMFFMIYTVKPISYLSNLCLNEKNSIIDMIDSYDICLSIGDNLLINSCENSEIYCTKLSNSAFKLNAIINLDENEFDSYKTSYLKFELEVILDLSECME